MLNEIWKDVVGYEGYYQVSNLGRVQSVKRTFTRKDGKVKTFQGRILKFGTSPEGYKHVNLSVGSEVITWRVYRLVAMAFLENPNNYKCINHKDENKSNNNLNNIEWCDYSYNNTYNGKHLARATKVSQYTKSGEYVNTYESQGYASSLLGIKQQDISRCCLNKRKSCGGYVWKFANA